MNESIEDGRSEHKVITFPVGLESGDWIGSSKHKKERKKKRSVFLGPNNLIRPGSHNQLSPLIELGLHYDHPRKVVTNGVV